MMMKINNKNDLEDDIIELAKSDLLNYISHNSYLNADKIERAIDFAIEAHKLQKRASGEPYVLHPIAVAKLVAELGLDTTSIIVALLHDVIEDTNVSLSNIGEKFGQKEAELINGVTKLGKIKNQSANLKDAENLRKLLLAISKDIRVLLVKLADRLHNMKTLEFITSPEKRARIAKDTFEIYSPLAERIGLQKYKNELQDLAFKELYPEIRESIQNRLNYLEKNGILIIEENIKIIQELLKSHNIKCTVTGRAKTPHSIWRKMEHKKISFEALSDIMAFRILTHSVSDCYKILGIIHEKFHFIPSSFQDYISNPKSNGYQSLHTLVIGPQNRSIEIQIRTHNMHEIAELGVAAHWSYKQDVEVDALNKEQYKWIKQLCEVLENSNNSDELMENAKLEMKYNQVFCFTPSGKLVALPNHSTALDFAFALSNNMGLYAFKAKINGNYAPLKTLLQNGDQVEIIKGDEPLRLPSCLRNVITGKAKSEIKKFLEQKQKREFINIGRAILIKTFKKYKKEYNEFLIIGILAELNLTNIDDLFSGIGKGIISVNSIINTLYPKNKKFYYKLNPYNWIINNKEKNKKALYNDLNTFNIDGISKNNLTIQIADCCCPVPGEKIIGIISPNEGVIVHTNNCNVLQEMNLKNDNVINIFWNGNENKIYQSKIRVSIFNRPGTLAELTQKISELNINIFNVHCIERSLDFFELLIDLEIRNIDQLNELIKVVKSLDSIYSVSRYKK